ncbi:PEPxxWA-CTERM sorting domain-containing protein [uncultured Sphingomonas sp.]|uniref:PEPxxWA-CTERM sorting domain-containing protein n=1 Tax=uncultured Sphingomonas sp. TaxID=158754 RepID=UPI0035CB259B
MAALAATMVAGSANATVITATYDFTSVFTSGPNSAISGSIGLTYDTTNYSGTVAVNNFTSTLGSAYTPVTASYINNSNSIIFGDKCTGAVCDVSSGTSQFYNAFYFNTSGDVTFSMYLVYSAPGTNSVYYSTSNVVTRRAVVASPTPEPASWAMMIAGFGLVGVAMRRRVALAFA